MDRWKKCHLWVYCAKEAWAPLADPLGTMGTDPLSTAYILPKPIQARQGARGAQGAQGAQWAHGAQWAQGAHGTQGAEWAHFVKGFRAWDRPGSDPSVSKICSQETPPLSQQHWALIESVYQGIFCLNGAHLIVSSCSSSRKLNITTVFRRGMTISSFASSHFLSLGVEIMWQWIYDSGRSLAEQKPSWRTAPDLNEIT